MHVKIKIILCKIKNKKSFYLCTTEANNKITWGRVSEYKNRKCTNINTTFFPIFGTQNQNGLSTNDLINTSNIPR